MRLLQEIAIFQTVKSKVIISLFETVRLSVSISLGNLYSSLNIIKEKLVHFQRKQLFHFCLAFFLSGCQLLKEKVVAWGENSFL